MNSFETVFRTAGIQAAILFVVGAILFGSQPHVGASTRSLASFYDGNSTRIFIATVVLGFGVLNLVWFSQALSTALADAGKGGWGRAQTAASAMVGALYFLHLTLTATLAYTTGSLDARLASGLNDFSWVLLVLALFPAAMVVMSGSFGLWRAGVISANWFRAGVTAMALLLLGTTTWFGSGFWAVDGGYIRVVAPVVFLVWITVASGFLVRRPSLLTTVSTRDRTAVATA